MGCLRQGLCCLGRYHVLTGKLLSRTVEVWMSADNFNILHFSYMKLSCYSRHCVKILTSEGFPCACALIKMMSYHGRWNTWRVGNHTSDLLWDAEPSAVNSCTMLRCDCNYMALTWVILEVENYLFQRLQKTYDSYSQFYGFRPVSVLCISYSSKTRHDT